MENPSLLDELTATSSDIANLNRTIDALRKKIQELEGENIRLKKTLAEKANEPPKSLSPKPSVDTLVVSSAPVAVSAEVAKRMQELEEENASLKNALAQNNRVSDGSYAPQYVGSTSPNHQTTPTLTAIRDDDDAIQRLKAKNTSSHASARRLITSQMSLASDPDGEDEHPDWVKKYSDQHKRVYWRHKVSVMIAF